MSFRLIRFLCGWTMGLFMRLFLFEFVLAPKNQFIALNYFRLKNIADIFIFFGMWLTKFSGTCHINSTQAKRFFFLKKNTRALWNEYSKCISHFASHFIALAFSKNKFIDGVFSIQKKTLFDERTTKFPAGCYYYFFANAFIFSHVGDAEWHRIEYQEKYLPTHPPICSGYCARISINNAI